MGIAHPWGLALLGPVRTLSLSGVVAQTQPLPAYANGRRGARINSGDFVSVASGVTKSSHPSGVAIHGFRRPDLGLTDADDLLFVTMIDLDIPSPQVVLHHLLHR